MRQGARTDLASKEAMSQPDAALALGVSRASVQRAAALKDESPKLFKAVLDGEVTVSQAVTSIQRKKRADDEQRRNVRTGRGY